MPVAGGRHGLERPIAGVLPAYSDDNKRSFGTTQCALHNHPKRITGELIIKMKFSKMALIAALACGTYAGNVFADQTNDIQLVSCAACDCGEPVCGCEPACDTECCDSDGCDSDCCDSDCCDSGCDACCDSGCGYSLGDCSLLGDCGLFGDCCLGEPCTLFGEHCGYSAGGWLQFGYHSKDLPAFNTYSDHLQLQQAWLFAEKAVDGRCGCGRPY